MLPRNGLLQYRIASAAPIAMSIPTPQADIVTLPTSSWQCIQTQAKDYLEEIGETMLWLGSLHLQQGPFQSLLGVSSKFLSTPDAEGALYSYPIITEVQLSREYGDPIFHQSDTSHNPDGHNIGEEHMLQAEDMSNWASTEKGKEGVDLDDAYINLQIRREIWRRERKKKKGLHLTRSFPLDGTGPKPVSSVPNEPPTLTPSASAASSYQRSGHRYLARRQIRKKTNVLDNRRTFLKREWKSDDDDWRQPSELEILRDAGIEVSHTPMTWAEQSLIDYKKTPWSRCYRSSMLRWSWSMTEEGEEGVEKGDEERQSEMEFKG